MRILVIGKFYEDSFSQNISETLVEIGHASYPCEIGRPRNLRKNGRGKSAAASSALRDLVAKSPLGIRRLTSKVLSAAEEARPDLVVVCHDFLYPSQVAALRAKTGAPIALWFPDSIGQFHRAMFLAGPYDALFFKDPYIVEMLRRELRARAYYLPECCNPRVHRPVELNATDILKYGADIAIAGNLYPSRVALFAQLKRFRVSIWGNPAPSWVDTSGVREMLRNEYVTGGEKVKAFLAAKIVLNNLHPAEIWGVNARAFEVCGIGAFQIISWRPALDQLFDDGEEVVTFRSVDELHRKLDFYLQRTEERVAIAGAGRRRALKEHTYSQRLELLIRTISGNASGFSYHKSSTGY
jgi:spore maturation protein CgeB